MTRDECRKQSRPPRALRAALRGRRRGVERPGEVGTVVRARSPARRAPTLGLPRQPRGRNRSRARGVPLARGAARAAGAGRARGPGERVRRDRRRARSPRARGRSSRSRPGSARAPRRAAAGSRPSSSAFAQREQSWSGRTASGLYDGRAELDLALERLRPGPISASISQSGNLAIEVVAARGKEVGLGISRFVSIGNQADLEAAELVEELAAHEPTRADRRLLEDFRDGRAFARAAAEAGKPVLLLAGGTSAVGRPRGPLAHGRTRQRVGRDRRGLPRRRHRSRLDSTRAGRRRAAAARARSAPGTAGRDRHRRRRLGGRRCGSRERRAGSSSRALSAGAVGAACGGDAPDGDDEQPRRLRRRRRAGPHARTNACRGCCSSRARSTRCS